MGVKIWDGRIRTSEMAGPKPAALPLGDVPSPDIYYNMISRLIVKAFIDYPIIVNKRFVRLCFLNVLYCQNPVIQPVAMFPD